MVPTPNEAQIRAMSPEARLILRTNAAKQKSETGDALVALIDSLHLPLGSNGGMSADDPVYVEMRGIAWSAEGKETALKAVAKGFPALAGLDPLLQAKMGGRYRIEGQGRENAGYIVAEVMRCLGYEQTGTSKLPDGCLAKSGATWRPKSPSKK